MSYQHYGAIGDMIKHLPLASFLKIESPAYYCETHSACAIYDLDEGYNKKYGIFHLYENASKSKKTLNRRILMFLGNLIAMD